MRSNSAVDVPDEASTFHQHLRNMMIKRPRKGLDVAEEIGIHRRTLSRWLKSDGTNFKQVLKEARLAAARHLLAETSLSLTEVSSSLGFSEPAAFTHAFRRWTGTTPSAWRKKHQHVEPRCSVERPDSAHLR